MSSAPLAHTAATNETRRLDELLATIAGNAHAEAEAESAPDPRSGLDLFDLHLQRLASVCSTHQIPLFPEKTFLVCVERELPLFLERLLSAGADPNPRIGAREISLLGLCVEILHDNLARLLIDHGADTQILFNRATGPRRFGEISWIESVERYSPAHLATLGSIRGYATARQERLALKEAAPICPTSPKPAPHRL